MIQTLVALICIVFFIAIIGYFYRKGNGLRRRLSNGRDDSS